ncbi:alpha/beta-hydrolase [Thozetella sp. PMI_491]|nr:alpha/beta-hydrolase [Thozetella sp. PMI_491]
MMPPTSICWRVLLCVSLVSPSICAPSTSSSSSSVDVAGDCHDYDIPVTTKTEAHIWGGPEFSDNYDVAAFIGTLISRPSKPPFNPFNGTRSVTGSYTISATFCSPKTHNGHEKTILLASPGLGYDKRYWAPSMNASAYSFAEYAVSKGYSVFLYDRIGSGNSTRVSGYSESQSATQLAILASLTGDLRAGRYTGSIGKPAKIVHVGHSYGSFLTHSLVSQDPSLSDGIVLTGIGYNVTDFPAFFQAARLNIANTVSPGKYSGLDSGYLAFSDIIGNAATFFNPRNLDHEILWYTQYIAQPPAIMEFITGGPTDLRAVNFTGPVLILTGELDMGNCAGNCNGILQHPAQEYFNKSRAFQATVHPNSGHGINFNLNATGAYQVITDFLTNSGL